jgi:hypothetical protein
MDNAVLVGVVQRPCGFPADLEGHIHRELPLAANPVAEALALDKGHREPQQFRPAVPPSRCPAVQYREDVRVLQPGGEADLALEALRPQRRGQLGMEHLERHRPVVPDVVREVDRRHPAPAQLPLDRVAVLQRFTHTGDGIGHGSLGG